MKLDWTSFLLWSARALALGAFLFWTVMFFLEGLEKYLVPGILLLLALAINNFISWQNEAVGGSIFLVLGIIYFIVIAGKEISGLYFYSSATFLAPGIIFLSSYFYREKKEMEVDDF